RPKPIHGSSPPCSDIQTIAAILKGLVITDLSGKLVCHGCYEVIYPKSVRGQGSNVSKILEKGGLSQNF
ncbi:MAG: hypothetical protein P8017_13315, partial [Deltaproteobacteria bacterium]